MQVKTRLQAAGCPPSATVSSISRGIMATDGATGLWRGTVPAAARAALLTASQCVTYDVVKQTLRKTMAADDSFGLQVATGVRRYIVYGLRSADNTVGLLQTTLAIYQVGTCGCAHVAPHVLAALCVPCGIAEAVAPHSDSV